MNHRFERVAILAILSAAAVAAPALAQKRPSRAHPTVIYGPDDRQDLYQVTNPKVRALADSTVALFDAANVSEGDAGASKLSTQVYGERMGLCKDEPFFDQPMGAFCSGSLVAPDVIMTAGHCVTSQEGCQGVKFVFGFGVKEAGKYPTSVPSGEIYGCQKLLGREQNNTGADWALVKLDRPVSGHKPLALNREGEIKKGTPLFVIGHPVGLPTKVAGGAAVRDDSHDGFLQANLDTYGGNSGSAVFNGVNGLVEGVLVRGETDFVYKDGCRVSNRCPDDGCRGEDVTRISAVIPNLPTAIQSAFQSPGEASLSLLRESGADARVVLSSRDVASALDALNVRDAR